MSNNIVKFPGRGEPAPSGAQLEKVEWRTRDCVQADIDEHMAARSAYAEAVAWEAAAESQNLPPVQIEKACQRTAEAYSELHERGRRLLICMPTDVRALIDLLLYLEKNFTSLPVELWSGGGGARQAMALTLLHTVRLSLRAVVKYGKHGPTT